MPLIEGYSKKNRGMAVFLGVFLGVFGLHRFYLGKPKTGLLWLCTLGLGLLWLCTLGLGLLGWVFDMFALIFGKAKDADGLPLPPFGLVYSSCALRKKPLANVRCNNDKKAVRYVEPLFYWNRPGVI